MAFRYLMGGMLILLGIGFLLDQTGVIGFSYILSTWWPLAIIFIGALQLTRRNSTVWTGSITIIVGLLLQANELGYLHYGFWAAFWPLLLVLAGIMILTKKTRRHRKSLVNESSVDYFAMFNSIETTVESQEFHGGKITAIFGSAEVDLRDIVIPPGGADLELSVTFGGIELFVPRDCIIKYDGSPVFGGFEDKTKNMITNAGYPEIRISYTAIFGGIEIKN